MLYDLMKKSRENKELTQKELSKKLGISRSTYAGWENGIDSISLSRLNDLCNYSRYERGKNIIPTPIILGFSKYYNVSIDYLCGKKKDSNVK